MRMRGFVKRVFPVAIVAAGLVACGGGSEEPDAAVEGETTPEETAPAAETKADRAGTWFETSGAVEASASDADAYFSWEKFSETWMLNVTAQGKGTVAFRFPDGFEPRPGEYPIAYSTAEGVIATFVPADSDMDDWFVEDQTGTLEITETGETVSATFEYSATKSESTDTVTVEGAFSEERGDAFGPPPSS